MYVLMLGQLAQKLLGRHPHVEYHVNHFCMHPKLSLRTLALLPTAQLALPSIFKNIIIA
jgi:hypothetical protein